MDAFAGSLRRGGLPAREAADRAVDAVATIQGALILARARDDDATLSSILARVERRLLTPRD